MTQLGIGGVSSGVSGGTTTISDPSTGNTGSASPLGSQVTNQSLLNMGVPDTSQGAQFELEEQAAAAARGQSYATLWAGFKLPAKDAGDFWTLYSQAETFAANTGWQYLPTPQMLISMLANGFATANTLEQMAGFAQLTKVNTTKMPWAALGMSSTQYQQAQSNVGDALFETTGKTSFAEAGLSAIEGQAMTQGWSSTQLSDYIQKNPALNNQYGYLKYGQNYQQFAAWKQSNAQTLSQRYGTKYTDQQAVQELGNPQQTFHANAGTFGESVPYVTASSQLPTGRQSSVR
jgi:hypothetical protein